MSFDAKGLLEVNRELIVQAARQGPIVLSVATWGRGCKPKMLKAMEAYVCARGHNSSLILNAPADVVCDWFPSLSEPLSQVGNEPGRVLVVGVAYGKTDWQWWSSDGTENSPQLF